MIVQDHLKLQHLNPRKDSFRSLPAKDDPPKEPDPPPQPKTIRINLFPQDPLVTAVEQITIPGDGVTEGPATDRLAAKDSVIAAPDQEGNYLFDPSTPQFDSVEAFASAGMVVSLMEKYLGRKVPWAFGRDQLEIYPHAGEDLNAYYSRWDGSVNFFYKFDQQMQKTIQSSQSLEVTGHETGHAWLDAVKPQFFSFSGDAAGYHEAFGDMVAMVVGMQDDQVVAKFLDQTHGDFKKQNLVARLAEELGRGVNNTRKEPKPDHDYIRNANNELTWSDPKDLPWSPPDETKLGREPHNYSRLFTGAFYDILSGVYRKSVCEGTWPPDAVKKAGEVGASFLARSLDFCPESLDTFKQMAQAFLKADEVDHHGAYSEILKKVFKDRKILGDEDLKKALEPPPSLSLSQEIPSGHSAAALARAQALLEANQEALGVKGLPLKAREVVTNSKGEVQLSYGYTKEVQLNGQSYGAFNGATIDVNGDLRLIFNREGKLISSTVNLVTTEDESQVKEDAKKLITEGMVKYVEPFYKLRLPDDFFKSKGQPYFAYTQYADGKMKLVRTPVVS